MYKSILALLLIGLLAAPVFASAPPAYGDYQAGWGFNPNYWQRNGGECPPALGIFNPETGEWYLCPNQDPMPETMCQVITVELWIELYAVMTVWDLSHQFHSLGATRGGDYFEFYIGGTTSANHPLRICMCPGDMFDLNYLMFVEDIFGNYSFNGDADIPLNWAVSYGRVIDNYIPEPDEVDYERVYPDPYICIDIPDVCDWWWYFYGWFVVVYHEDDGYYVLYFAICPTPIL
jgi:hypothetical protein